MSCPYLHKLCPKPGCNNWVCRAFFPERQPTIQDNLLHICQSEKYGEECPNYVAGTQFREKKRLDKVKVHCPFASNNICGHPEIWTCKGYPHRLYPAYIPEKRRQRLWRQLCTFLRLREPAELHNSKPVEFTTKQLEATCWSGKKEVYVQCPNFQAGLMQYGKTAEEVLGSK